MLLLGAGRGEATCGILYLAGYLRRHGIEAFVRLYDDEAQEHELEASLRQLMSHVKPQVVGVSLKWFNHLSRGLVIARMLRRIDPDVRLVTGGNSASYFWQQLAQLGLFDDIVLGDGELPLLSLCRGEQDVPNLVTTGRFGQPQRRPLRYVQSVKSDDVYYSHFDEVFLSGLDRTSFSGWVQPGKGCSENCVYCGGTRGLEQASFGRPTSFLRPAISVQRDHDEIVARTWQLRYDFAGGTAEFLRGAWRGHDLSAHAATYFLWGVPPPSLVDELAATFGRVYMVLDIGCFSQRQRSELMKRGLLKPCPTDDELMTTVELCRRHRNLKLEVCGIAGLPHTSDAALAEELPLVERLLDRGCDVGSQRLESQPGALVTQHAQRFGMVAEAHTFDEFVDWFAAREHATSGEFPMVRFADGRLEAKVQRAYERVFDAMQQAAPKSSIRSSTKLVATVSERFESSLETWLGAHRVPPKLRSETLWVLRSRDGNGLSCAPQLPEGRLAESVLQQGETAALTLATLEAFTRPMTVAAATAALAKKRYPRELATEAIEALAAGGFLAPPRNE